MNDYKELIDILNDVDFADCCEHCFLPCSGSGNCFVLKAADAIEQLVKERDAAVKWIPRQCDTCRHYKHDERETSCMKFGCENWKIKENWEWRGVTDDKS